MREISKTGYWNGETAHHHHVHSEKLSEWICEFIEEKGQTSMVDYGCGLGQYCKDINDYFGNWVYILGVEGNKLSDSTYLKIKNNAWKHADTDWVIVCDVDEFLKFDKSMLNLVELNKETMFKSKGFNMCNVEGLRDITEIKHGVRAIQYDKTILFNRKHLTEINYSAGCHSCEPQGDAKESILNPHLYHMKFIDVDLLVNKYKSYASRLSDENKEMRWGYHYEQEEWLIREEFKNTLQLAEKIR